jgi:hypothetical protein
MAKSYEYRTLAMAWGHGENTEKIDTELNRLGKLFVFKRPEK